MIFRAAAFSLLFYATHSFAYLAPTFHVVNKMAKKHSAFSQGRLRHRVNVLTNNGQLKHRFLEVMIIQEGVAKIKTYDENQVEILSTTREMNDSDRGYLFSLLFESDANVLFESLKSAGLVLKTEDELYSSKKEGSKLPYEPETNLEFRPFGEKIYQVIKGKSRDTELWLEREETNKETSLLPLRALISSTEYRIENYQPYGQFRYPTVVTVFRDKMPWLKIETLEVSTGKFDEGVKAVAGEPSSDLKSSVEEYLKWIR